MNQNWVNTNNLYIELWLKIYKVANYIDPDKGFASFLYIINSCVSFLPLTMIRFMNLIQHQHLTENFALKIKPNMGLHLIC